MRAVLPALLLVAACAQPAPDATADAPPGQRIEEPAFDAGAWMADVRAAETDGRRVELAGRLLDAVDWREACGEDDPTAPGRGVIQLHAVGGGRTLAEITCQAFAYQSVFALVDADAGRPPRLVRSLTVTDDGEPTENVTASFHGVVSTVGEPPGAFDILTKSAGHGGCGTHVRYRLAPDGGGEITEVRAHADCDEPLAPEAWPVTFSR